MRSTGRRFPLVHGTVVEHRPFGYFVDIGDEEPGLVVITAINDDPMDVDVSFPPIGVRITAALVARTLRNTGGLQARLSVRPRDLARAAGVDP